MIVKKSNELNKLKMYDKSSRSFKDLLVKDRNIGYPFSMVEQGKVKLWAVNYGQDQTVTENGYIDIGNRMSVDTFEFNDQSRIVFSEKDN